MSSGLANLKAISSVHSHFRGSRILIADHEKESCESLRGYLEQEGYEITTALTCASVEQSWRVARPDVIVLDSALPDGDILTLVPRLKASDPLVPLIVLTKENGIGLALQALRLGAEQFLAKPVDLSVVAAVIQRNLEYQELRRRHLAENSRLGSQNLNPLVGESNAIRTLADLAGKASLSDSPVLIEGERGTGKGLLALWLHQNGSRASERFVELNCAELSRKPSDSQVFRDEGSSFASEEPQARLLEWAHRGTALLSQIQKIDLGTQSSLLQALGEGRSRETAHGLGKADIRLMATTEEDLSRLVRAKRFRPDLYSRISGFTLRIPPLRERLDDLPLLATQILDNLASELGNSDFDLTRSAVQVLQRYSWPGNIRELKNVLERAVLVASSTLLTAADLRLDGQRPEIAPRRQFRSLQEVERQYIEQVLDSAGGKVQVAAKILGVPRSSLYHKLKQYRIERLGLRPAS